MQLGATGLTEIGDQDLKRLLAAVHRGDLECPLDLPGLTRNGLQHVADGLGHLRGLDQAGVRAVVVAALAERRKAQQTIARLRAALEQATG